MFSVQIFEKFIFLGLHYREAMSYDGHSFESGKERNKMAEIICILSATICSQTLEWHSNRKEFAPKREQILSNESAFPKSMNKLEKIIPASQFNNTPLYSIHSFILWHYDALLSAELLPA